MSEQNSTGPGALNLEPRRVPIQSRAKKTVEKILDCTAELLDESGIAHLTTDRVAERADVNIATLYHYFPNKQALIVALADRLTQQQEQLINSVLAKADQYDWQELVDRLIDITMEGRQSLKGAVAIQRAMQSEAELRAIDHAEDVRHCKVVAEVLSGLGIAGTRERLEAVSLVFFQMATSAIDKALEWNPDNAEESMNDVKAIFKAYIQSLIDQSAAAIQEAVED
jgi:AcrR family transcriptional regulator